MSSLPREEIKVPLNKPGAAAVAVDSEKLPTPPPQIPAAQVIQATLDYAKTTVGKLDSFTKLADKLIELMV